MKVQVSGSEGNGAGEREGYPHSPPILTPPCLHYLPTLPIPPSS